MASRHLALAAVLTLAAPPLARPSPPPLGLELPAQDAPALPPSAAAPRLELGGRRAALLAAGALVLWGAAELERALDDVDGCRWCEPTGVDTWARRSLRWSDPAAAGSASDVVLYGVLAGSAVAVAALGAPDGRPREVLEDVYLVAVSVVIADALTRGIQHATARPRPYVGAAGPQADRDLRSFFSGHTSLSFAAATAAAQVTRLRGRRGWQWVAVAGLGAAAAAGWLRIAADQHWATDVLGGTAAGIAVGWAVPAFGLRPARGGEATIVPAPGGLAIVF
jgi:membrane-associated phospholipid phosphatase